MNIVKKVFLPLALLLAVPTIAAQEMSDPAEFIDQSARAVLNALDGKREAVRRDSAVAEQIVEQELLPHIDVDYIARLVLAQHWRSASPQQRERFKDAFQQFLLKSYGRGLAEFTEERMKVLPLRGQPDPRRTIVQTEIYRDTGSAVPVAYTLRWTDDGWKVFDVIIEGISYVRNYRTDFNTEIEQRGLDALISRLERGIGPAAPGTEEAKEKSQGSRG